ncbi:hypothetical protein O6H91_07G038700 [Diphasiastrum complanatum]|uniref:Uncharacterized protein n=1 Tax=Diphasiastrum complanatum TaxID=34168 RepID=A0ACC2D478_DIPCM|nr:hypothetical protein O6H91_07G038700 [Diphasiastrum complanatum]
MLGVPRDQRTESAECLIREGDVVIVYERHDRMKQATVCKGKEFQNRFGVFPYCDWIGKPFGSRVVGKKGIGFVYLLKPTPELWTLVLSHRTQILYVADISFVVGFLEIGPGKVVLESGTGSGSLTTSLARSIAPLGHVYSFDFHELRAEAAREDFKRNGLGSLVTVAVRDIQGQGFPEDLVGRADAVFLDLPQPWLVIPHLGRYLEGNVPLCSFSPCIEQVQRTCEALTSNHFTDIRTFEVLLRSYDVRTQTFGSLSMTGVKEEIAAENLSQVRKLSGQKRGRDGLKQTEPLVMQGHVLTTEEVTNGKECIPALSSSSDIGLSKNPENTGVERNSSERIVARPYPETRGHTGFLTFARQGSNLN